LCPLTLALSPGGERGKKEPLFLEEEKGFLRIVIDIPSSRTKNKGFPLPAGGEG